MVIIYPIKPQPGKVSIQAETISFTTEKLMAEILLTAQAPMIEVVFAWVVETGMPNTELKRRATDAAISAENPWYFSSFTISIPTDLMIFLPPMEVPSPMTAEHNSMSHTGI